MHQVISADGTRIAYQRSGAGPAVILVGGAFNDHAAAAPLARALAPRLTAVCYDRRGRGSSTDTQPYAVEREVEDIGALLAELGPKASLCGFSSGAVLALEAVAAGLDVGRVVAFEPPFRLAGGPDLPPGYQEQLTGLISAGRRGDAVEYFMTRAVGLSAEAVGQMRRSPAWPGLEALAPTVAYDGLVMRGHALPAGWLASITVPALVLDSTGSAPWLRNGARAAAEALGNARHRSLDGTFHQIPPEILAPVVAEFLAA